ncbi:MAG: ASCH domain-containing protein [Parascardovia denticolens]
MAGAEEPIIDQARIQVYWEDFCAKHGLDSEKIPQPEAFAFGLGSEMEDYLAALVKRGIKTATTSAYELYQPDEHLPQVGEYNIILDSKGDPVCVTQTMVVEVIPFNRISQEHAWHEGEGDRSYDYWYQVHLDFFKEEYKNEGKGLVFHEDASCLCEVFQKID